MSVPALPFPAAEMETLARSQAWVRFLGEVRFSLEVWATDSEVRDGCEPVVEWIRRCGRELSTFGSGR